MSRDDPERGSDPISEKPEAGAGPEIRSYRETDRDQVIRLWTRVFPEPLPRNAPAGNLDRRAGHDPELFLVATREEGRVIATTMAGYDGHRGWLYLVAVDPDERRCGVGRAVVERACALLAARGCPKVNLQVMPANRPVTAFYEAMGFAVEERISLGRQLLEDG